MNQEYAVESTPRHLWIVGILAVLWNAMGGLDFVMTHTRNEAWLAGFTPEQLEYFLGFPLWANVTWGIAVWGSIIASILLLARSRFALTGFLVSLIAMTLTTVYNYLLTDGLAIMGAAGTAFSAFIYVCGVLFYVYARRMSQRGVLR